MEVPVLRAVELLVHRRRGAAELPVIERRVDVCGSEHPGAHREMNARGEQRVDEAGGVADQHPAVPGEPLRAVRPVALDLWHVDQRGASEEPSGLRGERELLAHERLGGSAFDRLGGAAGVEDDADAGDARGWWPVQRDDPDPAGLGRLDEDVRLLGVVEPRDVGEVAVNREVLEVLVPLTQPARARDQSALPARIDDEARLDGRLALVVGHAKRRRRIMSRLHFEHARALSHVNAVGGSVVEQDAIEFGADDLVGVRVLPARLLEAPVPPRVIDAPDHRCAPLLEEAGVGYGLSDTELLEDWHGGGQQRLADVVAREALAFEEQHLAALLREHRGDRRAAGPAADDGDLHGGR